MGTHATPLPTRSSEADPDTALLVLPGMTLNSTTMPAFPWAGLSVDFTQFRPAVPDADIDMGVYRRELDRILAADPATPRRRRVVVAHSFGGMLALDWVIDSAHRGVRSADALVLVATTAGPMFDVVQLRVGRIAGREIRVPMKPLLPLWNHPTTTRAVKRLVDPSRAAEGRVDFTVLDRPSDLAVDLAGWRNTDWQSMRAYRLAMRGWDRRAELDRVDLPTMILHGGRDSLFPVAVAEDLARRLPHARLRVRDAAGHALPLTHGGDVIQAVADVLDWLDR